MTIEKKMWNIYHGDCLDWLRRQDIGCADAIVTDPPYCSGSVSEASRSAAKGQGLRSENIARFGWFTGDNMGTAGLVFLLRQVAFEALRIVKPSGSMLVFCDWRMVSNLAPAIESSGWRFQNIVVWDKGVLGLGNGFRCQHELILHFTAGSPKYHDKSIPNVIKTARIKNGEREHQTQKPVDLIRKLIRVVSPRNGLVLDPFAGSGTTGVASLLENSRFDGCERELKYIEIANRRMLEAENECRSLFTPRSAVS